MRKNVAPPLHGVGDLVKKDMEKAEVLHAFFASVINGKICLQESQGPENSRKIWRKESTLHGEALRELINITITPLLAIFEGPCQLGKRGGIPEDLQKENVTPILKNGMEEDLENLKEITSNSWKMMEQLNVEATFRHEGQKGD